MSIIEFVRSRIERGAMEPVALSRINKLVRPLAREVHVALCAVSAPPAPALGRLQVRRVELAEANAFVNTRHRHLAGVVGHKFSLGVFVGTHLVGVAIVGRPVAAALDRGKALEVLRVATDGTRNACSKLLGAARRESRRRGIDRLYTYTLPSEGGASLRAAGFELDGPAGGGSWSRLGRLRHDRHPTERKMRWSASTH